MSNLLSVKKAGGVSFAKRLALCFAILGAFLSLGLCKAHATSIYEGAEAQAAGNAYQGNLSSYVVGEGSTDYATEFKNYKTYIIVHDGVNETRAINLKKGGLHVTLYGLYASTGDVTYYSDEACTTEVGKISLTTSSATTGSSQNSYMKTGTIIIPATGIYYVRFTNTTGGMGYYQMSTQQYDGRNRRLGTDKSMSFIDAINGPIYYMVTVKKDGYLTLKPEFCNNGYASVAGNVQMCLTDLNKKAIAVKKMIGNTDEDYAQKAVYAVKAGVYYVKVSSTDQRLFTLNCKQTVVKDKSGAAVKTAKKMKTGTWYKGIVTWNDTTAQADYYKFTLTKDAKVSLSVKGNVTSGKIVAAVSGEMVNGSYQGIYLNEVDGGNTWSISTKSSGKLPAGTYYVKISKDTKKTNGNYKIKVTAK